MKLLESVLEKQKHLLEFLQDQNFERALFVNEEIEAILIQYDLIKTNSESEKTLLAQSITLQEKIEVLFQNALQEEKSEYYIFKTKISLIEHFRK